MSFKVSTLGRWKVNIAQMFSNIIRKVVIVSLYAASVIYILISISFPLLLVQYTQESQRKMDGDVESFWSLLPGAVVESWSLGILWVGFVFTLIFSILILCVKKFWPYYQKNEILT